MASLYHKRALPIGTILKSKELSYKVKEILGYGGFGITYKVSANVMQGNIPIHTYFALKEHFLADCCDRSDDSAVVVSRMQYGTYKDSLENFKAEATRLNELSGLHKGIVRVNEVFYANNTVYYVMEFLNGKNIRHEVKDHGPYSEENALLIIKEIASAVAFLHKERITHLDIKPDNVIMHTFPNEEKPYPVLIDFGLAKHFGKDGKATSTIRVQGCSAGYSPIEQYVKIDQFSPTADIYSLAATLFFMLTGTDPLDASDITTSYIENHLPLSVSKKTRNTILEAMKKEKSERTPTVKKFLENLGENELGEKDGVPVFTEPLEKKNPKPSRIVYLVAAVFAVLGYVTPCLFSDDIAEDDMKGLLSAYEDSPKARQESGQEEHDMQKTEIGDSVDTTTDKVEKERLYNEYLAKAEDCCNQAEKRHGENATVQILLDAKYYYYDRAQSLSKELYGKSLQPNQRLDALVTKEFEYWVAQGDKIGKSKKNYGLKKSYYERAYKLREKKEIKSKIEWLDKQLSPKRRR